MSTKRCKQKRLERCILEDARRACTFFPPGDIHFSERPDLRINTRAGQVGVEVTELVRSRGENPFSPVQDENFHRKVVRLAEKEYYREADAQPVCVGVCFLDDEQLRRENREGWRRLADRKTGRTHEKMAQSLVEFVKNRCDPRAGSVTFSKREMPGQMDGDTLPTGFEVISVSWPPGSWHSGESATMLPLDRDQLEATIKTKDTLVRGYRANAPGLPIWLLIYNDLRVSKSVPIPSSIGEWTFAFDFDRVFLFSGIDRTVFEFRRT